MKRLEYSILLGLASSVVVSLTYLIRPADPDQSAGANFAWNLGFYFPAIATAAVLTFVSLGLFVAYLRQPIRKLWWSVGVVPILVLPCAYEVWSVVASMIAISQMAHGTGSR
jgi:hypothetical protein